jgi:hypothetical protein
VNWCKHTYRAWGIGLVFTALFGGGSYFAVDQVALHFWHMQLAQWIPAASAGGVGLLSLVTTWRAAAWCDSVLCVPRAQANAAPKVQASPSKQASIPLGAAALQSAAVGPDPSKAASATKPAATKAAAPIVTVKPAANKGAPPVVTVKVPASAAAAKPATPAKTGILGLFSGGKKTEPEAVNVPVNTVGVIVETSKIKIEADAPDQAGFSTVTVTTSGLSKRELTGQGGLFIKLHQVAGIRWSNHKGLGDGRKQIAGRVNPDKRQGAFNQLVQLSKQYSA